MNETIQGINERKSVRVFEEKPLLPAHKSALLNAAREAPTAGNQMLYSIIDIQSPVQKQALADSCDHQPFIATAPLVLVFVADCLRWLDLYAEAGAEARRPGAGDLLLACEDAIIAAQNTVVAAHSLGIGSCYIGDILENAEEVARLLRLPPYTVPVCMVVYGYPTAQQLRRQKPRRFEQRFVVHTDSYRRLSPAELREMVTLQRGESAKESFDDYITAFCKRKYMSDFSREMTRSAAVYLRQFEPFSDGE